MMSTFGFVLVPEDVHIIAIAVIYCCIYPAYLLMCVFSINCNHMCLFFVDETPTSRTQLLGGTAQTCQQVFKSTHLSTYTQTRTPCYDCQRAEPMSLTPEDL